MELKNTETICPPIYNEEFKKCTLYWETLYCLLHFSILLQVRPCQKPRAAFRCQTTLGHYSLTCNGLQGRTSLVQNKDGLYFYSNRTVLCYYKVNLVMYFVAPTPAISRPFWIDFTLWVRRMRTLTSTSTLLGQSFVMIG